MTKKITSSKKQFFCARGALCSGGLLFSLLAIWLVGIFFCQRYGPSIFEPELGRNLSPAGTVLFTPQEGYAATSIGESGSIGTEGVLEGDGPVVLLWGSSFVEGAEVSDYRKMHQVCNRILEKNGIETRVVNLGGSAELIADQLYQIPFYEQKYRDRIIGHVLVLSNFHELQPKDHSQRGVAVKHAAPGSWELLPPTPVPPISKINELKYQYHLNGFLVLGAALKSSSKADFGIGPRNHSSGNQSKTPENYTEEYQKFWGEYLKKVTDKPVFIIWAAEKAVIDSNQIVLAKHTALEQYVSELSATQGFHFASVTSKFNRLAQEKHILVCGFFNTPPGTGHFNRHGHEIIGAQIAELLSKENVEN